MSVMPGLKPTKPEAPLNPKRLNLAAILSMAGSGGLAAISLPCPARLPETIVSASVRSPNVPA
jgi:hypothetical protein